MAEKKPSCKLTGEDGNIFNLVAIARKALVAAGEPEKAKEMGDKVFAARDYNEALRTIMEYVEVR